MPTTKRKKSAGKSPAGDARAARGGAKPARGRGRPAGSGRPGRREHRAKPGVDRTRVTRHALARLLGVQQSLVTSYFAKPGAPALDKNMRVDREEGEKWVRDQSQWAVGGMSDGTKALKDRKLALEVEDLEREAAIRRGEVVLIKDIIDKLETKVVEIERLYRQKFEHELPPKYQGKNEVERRQLNVQALAEVAEEIRSGTARIETQVSQKKAS